MNFTENCMAFMERWNKGENERFRSYDYCKNLFDEYYQKPALTKEEKDYFALNLFCYLAAVGFSAAPINSLFRFATCSSIKRIPTF